MWRRAKKPDHRYEKRVRTTQSDEHRRHAWAIGEGRIVSRPYYKRDDPRPYYQVILHGESAGSFWRIDELIEMEPS